MRVVCVLCVLCVCACCVVLCNIPDSIGKGACEGAVLGIRGCASLEEHFTDFGVLLAGSTMQWGPSVFVTQLEVRVLVFAQQVGDCLHIPFEASNM